MSNKTSKALFRDSAKKSKMDAYEDLLSAADKIMSAGEYVASSTPGTISSPKFKPMSWTATEKDREIIREIRAKTSMLAEVNVNNSEVVRAALRYFYAAPKSAWATAHELAVAELSRD